MDDVGMSISEQVSRTVAQFGPGCDPSVLVLILTLYRTTGILDRAHAAELAPHGINLAQFNVISVLHRAGAPMSMSAIAEAVSVRPGNLTVVVDALFKRGLVHREPNPGDRRSLLVRLSGRGEEFLASFLPRHWQYLEALTCGLSPGERAGLTALLDRLAGSAQQVQETTTAPRG